jgi:putative addiction module CopG family antidote
MPWIRRNHDETGSAFQAQVAFAGHCLGQQLESFVVKLVKSGRYNSKSDVLRDDVRLVQDQEARITALDASIARGIADAASGNA